MKRLIVLALLLFVVACENVHTRTAAPIVISEDTQLECTIEEKSYSVTNDWIYSIDTQRRNWVYAPRGTWVEKFDESGWKYRPHVNAHVESEFFRLRAFIQNGTTAWGAEVSCDDLEELPEKFEEFIVSHTPSEKYENKTVLIPDPLLENESLPFFG